MLGILLCYLLKHPIIGVADLAADPLEIRNRDGHLWSIDLPPLERHWRKHVGVAVDGRHADRWSYIKGSSRRRLSELLSRLRQMDLFIHDSLHCERNVRLELDLSLRSS